MHISLVTEFVHSALNKPNLVEVSQCSLCILAFLLAAVTFIQLEVVTLSNSDGVHLSRFDSIGMED